MDRALITQTLFQHSFLPFTFSPSCFSQASPRPQSTKDDQQQPQHRATQALKICLSLMIRDFARHTDIPRTGWKEHFSSAVANPVGEGGLDAGWRPAPPRWSQLQPHREPQCPISMETSLALGWGPREPVQTSDRCPPHPKLLPSFPSSPSTTMEETVTIK